MNDTHPIAHLILSFISTSTTLEEARRAVGVAERAISRLPDEDTAHMSGICDAYNAADLTANAIIARLEGNVQYALRCENAVHNLLTHEGL